MPALSRIIPGKAGAHFLLPRTLDIWVLLTVWDLTETWV